jgi:hypothetical protein
LRLRVALVQTRENTMRKIVLVAAIAASALTLAACSETAKEADDMAEAMAADADSLAEEAAAAGDDAMEATEAAADEIAASAQEAAAEAEAAMDSEQ